MRVGGRTARPPQPKKLIDIGARIVGARWLHKLDRIGKDGEAGKSAEAASGWQPGKSVLDADARLLLQGRRC